MAADLPTAADDALLPNVTTTTTTTAMIIAKNRKRTRPPSSSPQQQPTTNNPLTIQPPPPVTTKPTSKPTRINWSKSPHRERLSHILSDWFSHSGLAINSHTNRPIEDYKEYATKVGISRTTLFKYLHKDVSKRRMVTVPGGDGGGNSNRGKKRLIDEGGVRFLVGELKSKAGV
mmetsp:Transcript_3062/g.5595  ORF Transcript_3062/g.5595 Transcript_3062/m.5595 type:complete len:174 (+) Transcript_3062:434-955(+)